MPSPLKTQRLFSSPMRTKDDLLGMNDPEGKSCCTERNKETDSRRQET